MAEHSENWDNFYESYFGNPFDAWHDGLNETALLNLRGDERVEAERLLTRVIIVPPRV